MEGPTVARANNYGSRTWSGETICGAVVGAAGVTGQTLFRAGRYRLHYKRTLSEGLAQFTGLRIFDTL